VQLPKSADVSEITVLITQSYSRSQFSSKVYSSY